MGRYREIPRPTVIDPRQKQRGFDMETFCATDPVTAAADHERQYQINVENAFDKVGKRGTGYGVKVGQTATPIEVTLTLVPETDFTPAVTEGSAIEFTNAA